MKKITIVLTSFLILISGCKKEVKPTNENKNFDVPQLLLEVTHQIILPTLRNFDLEASRLDDFAEIYVNESNENNLKVLRDQWTTTALAYERTYNFHIGKAKSLFINRAINNWPTVPNSIENFIENNEINEESVKAISPQIKAIPAIEYLLFETDISSANEKFEQSPKRKQYLKLATKFLKLQSNRLLNIWKEEGKNYTKTFIDNNGSGINESFNMLFNGLYNSVNTSKVTKIGKPGGLENSPRANPDLVQAPYSQESLKLLSESIKVIEEVFFTEKHSNISQYISSISKDNLINDRISKSIIEINQAIEAIPVPLEEAVISHPKEVEMLHSKLTALNVWIAVDARNILSVIITSTDTDGD
ncbi:MAG: imelysin family protein [Flavobacteriaceae bacterium]|nr:imelysin family protein [Flavobacteriaceae bacterium]